MVAFRSAKVAPYFRGAKGDTPDPKCGGNQKFPLTALLIVLR